MLEILQRGQQERPKHCPHGIHGHEVSKTLWPVVQHFIIEHRYQRVYERHDEQGGNHSQQNKGQSGWFPSYVADSPFEILKHRFLLTHMVIPFGHMDLED